MSTYVLMRILESAPSRYDLGMRWLTLGRLDRSYDRLAAHIQPGQRVLDLGCGTGALTLRAARRGARVKGIDTSPRMLETAARRLGQAGLAERVELCEMGVAELDAEKPDTYDVVTSGLCLSELSREERVYALRQVHRVLKPGGLLLVADEVAAKHLVPRVVQRLVRVPLALAAYAVTQQTTHPLDDPCELIRQTSLSLVSVRRGWWGGLCELVARKSTPVRP